MVSTKITTLNPLAQPNKLNQRLVFASSYNQLWDDVYNITQGTQTVGGVTLLAGNVTGTTGTFTTLVPTGIQISANVIEYTTEVKLTAAQIVGTTAGCIGHSAGAVLVAAPGAGYALEFISAVFDYTFATAAYTGGAADAVVRVGTVAQSPTVSADTALFKATSSKIIRIGTLNANETALTANATINYAGTAFTQPGTAAGTCSVRVTYRVHTV